MQPVRILIVDGNSDFLMALNNWLDLSPVCQVAGTAASGAAALAQIERLKPDLVLMSSVLPDMSSLQATLALKARAVPPKVIILTLGNESLYYTAYRTGADDVLDKADITAGLLTLILELFPAGKTTAK